MQIKSQLKRRNRQRGQGLVEFALAFPVFLLIVLGIFEFGRLFVTYISVYAAAREGARYGAAVDNLCNGQIETQAERAGFLAGDLNVTTTYERFDKELKLVGNTCDASLINAGDRVVVTVSTPFEFMTGFIHGPGGGPINLRSTAKRSIIKQVFLNWTLAPASTSVSAATATSVSSPPPGSTPTATNTPDPSATATPTLPTCSNATMVSKLNGTSPYSITITASSVYSIDSLSIAWTNSGSDLFKISMGQNTYTAPFPPDSPVTLDPSGDYPNWQVGVGVNTITITFTGFNNAGLQSVGVNMTPAGGGSQCTLP
jgi:hypothetical protein